MNMFFKRFNTKKYAAGAHKILINLKGSCDMSIIISNLL